jgi:hypothetical protein
MIAGNVEALIGFNGDELEEWGIFKSTSAIANFFFVGLTTS